MSYPARPLSQVFKEALANSVRLSELVRKHDYPVMRAAREARKETEAWSQARKDQARRIVNRVHITTTKTEGK